MLAKQRAQIDAIDQKLVQLLEMRLKVVEEVAVIKKENQLPIFDKAREANLLAQVALKVEDSTYTGAIEEIFQYLLKVSKEQQKASMEKGTGL
ncbi:chorismate mutase [Isobaculum melis]|uniref:Chorismate mutase n=1 Tax=Isobaculum melis TaxID=142588 RepID=A0A1H9U1T2_9LACT|nr:chorismate mutase [Isobaculum melis]SES03319.1 chorismate mutase [Isobaculum melis]